MPMNPPNRTASRKPRLPAGLACLLLVVLGLVASGPTAQAQDSAAPQPGAAAQEFSSPDAIKARLAALKTETARLAADGNPRTAELLQQLETALYQHLETADNMAATKRDAENRQEALRLWSGLDREPPYSIEFVDDLRAQLYAVERRQASSESRLRVIKRTQDDQKADLAERQRNIRRLTEQVETAATLESRQAAESARYRETLHSRILAERIARLGLMRESLETQQRSLAASRELLELQIGATRGQVVFPEKDLERIQARIAAERSRVLREARESGGSELEQTPLITWKMDVLDIEGDFWNDVHAVLEAAAAEDQPAIEAAMASLRAHKARVDDWVQLIRLQVRDHSDEISLEVAEQASDDDIRRVLRLQHQLAFVISQLDVAGISGPGFWETLGRGMSGVWDTELYLVEETAWVSGEKVTNFRAVTLGKLVRLAGILVIGWFALRFLSHQVYRLISRRPTAQPGSAEMARAWTFGLGLVILLIYGLNRVHIPLTAFAFLGGTLAIGIGFGAQTLLKNFISGIILGFERPFRVGDLVEVDTVLGTIKRIGLRASAIQHFDGTTTLVPNSSLLENRVTNWTYDENTMRGIVKCGVAYGSPTREVSKVLLGVAEAHGLVLDKPPPEVRFESFGDNALEFQLLFWFDARRSNRAVLASDLRFMIEKALADAGIVIAFPQRDVHFDEDRPLRIELSRSGQTRRPPESGAGD